jgi:hypothetical protein
MSKKTVIAELIAKSDAIVDKLSNDPGFEEAMKDRQEHISRGELWLTPAAIKYAQKIAELEQIRASLAIIRATSESAKERQK